jgi:hypothetical protein
MRRIYLLAPAVIGVLFATLFFLVEVSEGGGKGGTVSVRGYVRKDGTYVQPHTRTAPDGNPYNNYSYPGNYNPNTGAITPGDPATYLERYYNRSSSPPSTPSSSPVPASLAPAQIPQQPTRPASYWDAYERELKTYCNQTVPQAVSQCVREDLERQNDAQAQQRALKYRQSQRQEPSESVQELERLAEEHTRQVQRELEQSKKANERQRVAAIPQKQEPLREVTHSSNTFLFEQAQRDCSFMRGSTGEDSCIRRRMESIKNIEAMKTTNR